MAATEGSKFLGMVGTQWKELWLITIYAASFYFTAKLLSKTLIIWWGYKYGDLPYCTENSQNSPKFETEKNGENPEISATADNGNS